MNPLVRLWNALRDGMGGSGNSDAQLAAFVSELNREVEGLHRAVAGAIADEKRLKMQIEDHLARAGEWESRAMLALQENREDLAREALLRKEECEAQSLALQQSWDTQREATEKLKASLQTARLRVSDAKTKYTLLLAQYHSAATKRKLQQTLSASNQGSPMQLMERLSERIRLIEAQTEADLALGGADPTSDLDAAFVALERRAKGDEALRALKERLGERKLLPDQTSSTARIEELKAKLDRR